MISSLVFATDRDDLSSVDQKHRDTAAEHLRKTYQAPSQEPWLALQKKIKIGTSLDSALKILGPDKTKGESGICSGATCSEGYRLDDVYLLEISYIVQTKIITAIRLIERMQNVWVASPKDFTGHWVVYFVNGQKSHEIDYKNGKYSGKFISYHSNGKQAVVQNYLNGEIEGMDSGYFPSGKLMYKGMYHNGKQVGIWTWYKEDGQTQNSKNFDAMGTE